MTDKISVEISGSGAILSAEGSGAERLGHAVTDALSPFTEGLGAIGDQVRFYRQKRLEVAAIKLKELTSIERKTLHPVPPKQLVRWIEEASYAETDDLSDVWAKLLLGTSLRPSSINLRFMEILSQLGSIEVLFLSTLHSQVTSDSFDSPLGKLHYYGSQLAEDEIRDGWDRDIGQELAVETRMAMERHSVNGNMGEGWVTENYRSMILLKELGLIDLKSQLDDDTFLTVHLTPLGDEFVSVCKGDN